MTKLSDTQVIILAEASQRPDGNVLPLPASLRGGAQTKVIGARLRRGLIEERVIDSSQPPDASLNRVWRQDDDGHAILLYITEAGLATIGCEPEDADAPDTDAGPAAAPCAIIEGTNSAGEPAAGATDDATDAPKPKAGREGWLPQRRATGPRPGRRARPRATPRPRRRPAPGPSGRS